MSPQADVKICEKFMKNQDKINQNLIEKDQVNKKTNDMQQIIKKILKKNSPQATFEDKRKLISSLESIPMNKRKEVIIQLTK